MRVVVLTGAGISAESGIPTFRDANGLWEGHRPEEVATPEAFATSPELVHRFYNERRRRLLESDVQPNAAHLALADFEREHAGAFTLISQNVDDLHRRAGSKNLVAMHGEILKARCTVTNEIFEWTEDLSLTTPHPNRDDLKGTLRPHIVWFGELPMEMEAIERAASSADVFLAIGTSAVVYPAAGIVQWTPATCYCVEINLEDTPQSDRFNETIRNKASVAVPAFLERLAKDGVPRA
jgi:NAD-dependent deacetylase